MFDPIRHCYCYDLPPPPVDGGRWRFADAAYFLDQRRGMPGHDRRPHEPGPVMGPGFTLGQVAQQPAYRPPPRYPWVGDVPAPDPGGGGLFGPNAAAQAAFDDYQRRWMLMSAWSTIGPRTGRFLSFWGFPQYKRRWDFWEPWAVAWRAGNPDLAMLVAQRSNLNGAELDARDENANIALVNASVERANARGEHPSWAPTQPYPLMRSIPLYDGPSLDAPGVASSSAALEAAAAVDQAARDAGQKLKEVLNEDISPALQIAAIVGVGVGIFLLARALR